MGIRLKLWQPERGTWSLPKYASIENTNSNKKIQFKEKRVFVVIIGT